MKNIKTYTISLALALLCLAGCQNYEELQVDPNRPTVAPPAQIFTGIQKDLYQTGYEPWSETYRLSQFYAITFDYYGNQDYNWGSSDLDYGTLRNVLRMEQEAERLEDVGTYAALGKFFKAYFFVNMTQRVGDIPMTQALEGAEEFTPAYDTQKEVYKQAFQWLEEANEALAALSEETVAGDILLDGTVAQWQKLVNAFRLRVLISLSLKADDPDLNVKQQFAAIVADPARYPLISSLDESAKMTFYNLPNNYYPTNPGNRGFTIGRYVMAETYLNTLKAFNDPRVFAVAEPTPAATEAAKASGNTDYATDFDSYVAANSGDNLGDLYVGSNNGKYSLPKDERYYATYTGEPVFILGYPEVAFMLAEGINRGWAGGNAANYYQQGITASMSFYGIADEDIADYLAQPVLAYVGNDAQGLEQILTQKYLAFFQNSGWEAFYNQRRTGVPAFVIGPGNQNGGRIPQRWLYPQSEYQNNNDNIKAALDRQFNGADDINAPLWITNSK